VLGVPLLREGNPIGALFLTRGVVELFTQQQIDLVTTFADQAVIAIENVRLFDEVQARTHDLSEALQQQTATADVLKVISRSAFDLQTVLDTLVISAARLCDADRACIFQKQGEVYRWVSNFGFSAELIAYADEHPFSPERTAQRRGSRSKAYRFTTPTSLRTQTTRRRNTNAWATTEPCWVFRCCAKASRSAYSS